MSKVLEEDMRIFTSLSHTIHLPFITSLMIHIWGIDTWVAISRPTQSNESKFSRISFFVVYHF
jgi:hypothetical protein